MSKATAFKNVLSLLGKAKTIEPKLMDMFSMPRAKAVTNRKIAKLREWDSMNYKSDPTKSQGLTDTTTGFNLNIPKSIDQHNIKLEDDDMLKVALRQLGYDKTYNMLLNKNLGHLRNQTRMGLYQLPFSGSSFYNMINNIGND